MSEFEEDSRETEEEYSPTIRLYDLFHAAIRQLVSETEVNTADILATLGLVAGEVAEMYIEGDDGSDEEYDFSDD